MKMSDQGTAENVRVYGMKDEGYHMGDFREDILDTLVARDYKSPPPYCYGIDRAAFNQGVNALFNFSIDYELSAPIVAMGPNAVAVYADTE